MKNHFSKTLLILTAFFALSMSAMSPRLSAQPNVTVSMQVFYDGLSPYGDWIYDGRYGYVWAPYETYFRPYCTNGYWVMTEYGNTWMSTYTWGWAPFHYGRWIYDPYYGWVWIPGYTWGPAWVCWRHGGGFYGWAPLGPDFVLTIGFGYYDCPYDWWVFTPHDYIYGPRSGAYYSSSGSEDPIRTSAIVNHTTADPVTNHLIVTGPSAEEVEHATGRDVTKYTIRDAGVPAMSSVEGNTVKIYRPRIAEQGEAKPRTFQQAAQPITQQAQPADDKAGREFHNGVPPNAPEPVKESGRIQPQVQPVKQVPVNVRPNEPERQRVQPQKEPVKLQPPVPAPSRQPQPRTEPRPQRTPPQKLPVKR